MNFDNVNTEPFVGYHQFHEHINITIKILTSSLRNTISHVNTFNDNKELGRLIAGTDPAWNTPPVWSFDGLTNEQVYGFVSELGIVSVFSARDDFVEGVEAEITRWNSMLPDSTKLISVEDYENDDEKLVTLYNKYNWPKNRIEKYLPLVKYFRLSRNCIAHRNLKASQALSEYSESQELKNAFVKDFKNDTISTLPEFKANEKMVFDPKLSLFTSHLLRCIAQDVNKHLLLFLGGDGVLNMAATHSFFKEKPIRTEAYRTPEAIYNFILSGRYRVLLENDFEAISRASKLGLWKKCLDQYEIKYNNVGA